MLGGSFLSSSIRFHNLGLIIIMIIIISSIYFYNYHIYKHPVIFNDSGSLESPMQHHFLEHYSPAEAQVNAWMCLPVLRG